MIKFPSCVHLDDGRKEDDQSGAESTSEVVNTQCKFGVRVKAYACASWACDCSVAS